nr:hypothetical protein CFP56_53722 [Quercus suber]
MRAQSMDAEAGEPQEAVLPRLPSEVGWYRDSSKAILLDEYLRFLSSAILKQGVSVDPHGDSFNSGAYQDFEPYRIGPHDAKVSHAWKNHVVIPDMPDDERKGVHQRKHHEGVCNPSMEHLKLLMRHSGDQRDPVRFACGRTRHDVSRIIWRCER